MEVRSLDRPITSVTKGASGERVAAYLPLAVVIVLSAATRFVLLDHQSLWIDEIVSLRLATQHFGAMLHDIAVRESTPPLYYVLLWVWVRLVGTTAVAVRSLSACFGVATVAVLYLAARVRFSRGAALVTGALAATSPMLIWYSQETRAYALVTFMVTCSLYFLLRAPGSGARALAGWSVTAALALASQYFAVFVVVPEAVYLLYLYRGRARAVLIAAAGPVAVGALLLPLAIHQRNSGNASFIAAIPLGFRVQSTFNQYLLGPYPISRLRLLLLCLPVAASLFFSIARWGSRSVKRDSLLVGGLALAGIVLPLLVASGVFYARNMIVVLPLLLLLAGVAFVPRPRQALPVAAGLTAAALLLAPTVVAASRLDLQREDWRGMATLIGPLTRSRAVLVYPRWESIPLTQYRPDLKPVTAGKLGIREIVLVGYEHLETIHLPSGFQRVEARRLGRLRIVWLRSRTTRTLDVAALHLQPLLHLFKKGPNSLAHSRRQDATLLIERTP